MVVGLRGALLPYVASLTGGNDALLVVVVVAIVDDLPATLPPATTDDAAAAAADDDAIGIAAAARLASMPPDDDRVAVDVIGKDAGCCTVPITGDNIARFTIVIVDGDDDAVDAVVLTLGNIDAACCCCCC